MSPDERPTTRATGREATLLGMVVDLARGLSADTDVPELLQRLVDSCVELFPATSAGLMLLSEAGVPTVAAASSSDQGQLELLQLLGDQGPCLDCTRTGSPVLVDELAATTGRWPDWSPRALELGARSAYAFPLRLGARTFGALNLFGDRAGILDAADQAAATALADVAAAVVATGRQTRRAEELTGQLQHALESRVVIEQAKGIASVALHVSVDEAFQVLRAHSRSSNRRLADIAADLAAGRLDVRTLGRPRTRPAAARTGRAGAAGSPPPAARTSSPAATTPG